MTVPVAVCDANVLYPSTLRDILIRAGLAGTVRLKWTDTILDEVFDNLVSNRPDLSPARLLHTRKLMDAAIRDVQVKGHEKWLDKISLPDPNDCHVLAAAIQADADTIITKNLKDFPVSALSSWGISAMDPDDFLSYIYGTYPGVLLSCTEAIAAAWKAETATPKLVIASLAIDAPRVASMLSKEIR